MTSLALALVNATVAVVAMVIFGRLLLRPLFRLVAATGANELFVAATLFVIIGTGVAAAVAGLSMALGAFIAGLLLAETEFRKAIETTIGPFKGLLLGFFFFTVGMNIDVREVAREPFWLVASVIGLIVIKAILLTGLARTFRLPWHAAIETGLLLGPGGEFAFVGIGLATSLGLISANVSSFTLAVTSITMALIPVLALVARRLTPKFREPKALDPELSVAPPVEAPGTPSSSGTAGSVRSSARCWARTIVPISPSTTTPMRSRPSAGAGARSITATRQTRNF